MKKSLFVTAVVLTAAIMANAANIVWLINGDIPAGMEDCLAVLVMGGVTTPPTVGYDVVSGTPTLNANGLYDILAIMPVGDVKSFGGLTYAYPLDWGEWTWDCYNIENPELWASETDPSGGEVYVPSGYFYFYMIVFHSDTINGIGGSEWLSSDANGTYFEYQVSSAIGNPVRTLAQPEISFLEFTLGDWPGGLRSYTETTVPEPASAALLVAGFAVLLLRRRRSPREH